MITLTSVPRESINSLPLGASTSPEGRKAGCISDGRDGAAAAMARPRPTEAYDESRPREPVPAEGGT